jgi:hypothetical protein
MDSSAFNKISSSSLSVLKLGVELTILIYAIQIIVEK